MPKNNFSNLSDFQQWTQRVVKSLQSQDFFDYIKKKSREVVDEITAQNLNSDEEQRYSHIYRINHDVKVDIDKIVISNDVMIPVNAMKGKFAANYPNGFDLAKAIEYGTGIVGSGSDASQLATEDGWAYMVNTERDYTKPWFYIDENQELRWTKGMTGKLIYEKSKNKIEEELNNWINEYIEQIE